MTILVQAGKDLHLPLDRGQVWQPLQDQPFSVDDHRRTSPIGRVGQVTSIAGFRHAIGDGDGSFVVENDWERQTFFLHPGADRFLVPVINTKNLDISFHEVGIVVTVPMTVAGSITATWR